MQLLTYLYIVLSTNILIVELTDWVSNQFDQDSIEWIRVYSGYLDENIPVLMSLGKQGKEIKGIYRYQGEDRNYKLEGDLVEGKLSLVESSIGDEQCGFIIMNHSEDSLSGTWTNYRQQSRLPLNLAMVKSVEEWKWPKGNDWVRKFFGQYSGKSVELLLQKEKEVINGTMYLAKENKSYDLHGYCKDVSCSQIDLNVMDEMTNKIGIMSGQFFQANVIFVNYTAENSPSAFYSLPQRDEIILTASPEIEFCSIHDFTYPNHEGLKKIAKTFFESNLQSDHIFTKSLNPNNRLQIKRNGWQELHWMNSKVYSASFIYTDNISKETITLSINYDLKKDEIIDISTLFKKRSNFQKIINQFLSAKLDSQKEKAPYYQLQVEDFKHLGFMKEGFLVATDYDVLYGQTKWIIPYKLFDGEYSNGSIMSYFYKSK